MLAAAAIEGLAFSVTRAAVDRLSARGFEWLFGVWPGERADAASSSGESQPA